MELGDIVIDEDFKNFLPAVEDQTLLAEKIDTEGWSGEPITVWKEERILLDGHRRYAIWRQRGDAGPRIRERSFKSREEAYHWVVANQRSRRNLTPEQERYLLGRRYTAEKGVKGGDGGHKKAAKKPNRDNLGVDSKWDPHKDSTAARIGADAGVSDWLVLQSEKYANAVDDLDARGVVSKADLLSGKVKVPPKVVVEASEVAVASVEEAKSMVTGNTKGGRQCKNTSRTHKTKKANRDVPNTPEAGTDKQRQRAIYAASDVIDYLRRSDLMKVGANNPHREYAYKLVINWLNHNMKDKAHA